MEILALAIAILALIVSVAAYTLSRGQRNTRARERALDENTGRLTATAQRLTDAIASHVRSAYERHIRTIAGLKSRVAALKEEAIEEIGEDLGALAHRLDRLAERAAREIKDLKAGLDYTLFEMEIGLRLTIDDAKAHLKLIEAKRELLLARIAVARNDLAEAERRVEAMLRNIAEASALALGHHDELAALRRQAQALLDAIRARAETLRAAIDALLDRSNRLLHEMTGLEVTRDAA
jgi:hypothetical protein